MWTTHPKTARAVVVGGGTMGADVAIVLARGGATVVIVEPSAPRRAALPAHLGDNLRAMGLPGRAARIHSAASLDEVDWTGVSLVIECVPERLDIKQALFADLERRAAHDTVLASNSSSFPISAIAQGLPTQDRMLGLHFFMPAHLVPLVEVVLGPQTRPDGGPMARRSPPQHHRVPARWPRRRPWCRHRRRPHGRSWVG